MVPSGERTSVDGVRSSLFSFCSLFIHVQRSRALDKQTNNDHIGLCLQRQANEPARKRAELTAASAARPRRCPIRLGVGSDAGLPHLLLGQPRSTWSQSRSSSHTESHPKRQVSATLPMSSADKRRLAACPRCGSAPRFRELEEPSQPTAHTTPKSRLGRAEQTVEHRVCCQVSLSCERENHQP